MTYYEFSHWLQGVLDVNPNGLTSEQVEEIKNRIGKLTFPKSDTGQPKTNPLTTKLRC